MRRALLVVLLALLAGVPGSSVAMILLWHGHYNIKLQWILTVLMISLWVGIAFSAALMDHYLSLPDANGSGGVLNDPWSHVPPTCSGFAVCQCVSASSRSRKAERALRRTPPTMPIVGSRSAGRSS